MSTRKNIRKNTASLLAAVFVWLVIGTLVNFHQHHVYGKVLIFHASSTFTLKKDEHGTPSGKHLVTPDAGSLVSPVEVQNALHLACWQILPDPHFDAFLPEQPLLSGWSLRGPPLA
jgi:hypothetical protein